MMQGFVNKEKLKSRKRANVLRHLRKDRRGLKIRKNQKFREKANVLR